MDKKELKKLMTKVAKGEVSQKEADILIKGKKTQPDKPKQRIKGNAQKRSIKAGGKIK